jgi:hypothetical protein
MEAACVVIIVKWERENVKGTKSQGKCEKENVSFVS